MDSKGFDTVSNKLPLQSFSSCESYISDIKIYVDPRDQSPTP